MVVHRGHHHDLVGAGLLRQLAELIVHLRPGSEHMRPQITAQLIGLDAAGDAGGAGGGAAAAGGAATGTGAGGSTSGPLMPHAAQTSAVASTAIGRK